MRVRDAGDYGLGPLYAPCIRNGSFIGQRWVADLPIPGSGGETVETVSLGNSRLLSQLSGDGIETGVRWNNNPEFVCFVICRIALGDDCTYFTYDGLDADRCGALLSVMCFVLLPCMRCSFVRC